MQDSLRHPTLSSSNLPGSAPAPRVSLLRWGLTGPELDDMVRTLGAAERRIAWTAGDHGARADLVVHVVDLAALAGPGHRASWNLMGPVEAMRAARAAGVPAIALVKGEARHLPPLRTGCWVTAGPRDPVSAARILAGAAILGARDESVDDRRQRLAALASANVLAQLHRVIAPSCEALVSTVRELCDDAARHSYAEPSRVHIGIGGGVALDAPQGGTPTRIVRSQATDTEADVLLAYPWPDLSGSGDADASAS